MEFEPEECDYDIYGDTRNPKGKIEQGYTRHNKGYKEQKRIYYIKEQRMMQSQAAKGLNQNVDEEEVMDNSKKRKLKYTANEEDKNYLLDKLFYLFITIYKNSSLFIKLLISKIISKFSYILESCSIFFGVLFLFNFFLNWSIIISIIFIFFFSTVFQLSFI